MVSFFGAMRRIVGRDRGGQKRRIEHAAQLTDRGAGRCAVGLCGVGVSVAVVVIVVRSGVAGFGRRSASSHAPEKRFLARDGADHERVTTRAPLRHRSGLRRPRRSACNPPHRRVARAAAFAAAAPDGSASDSSSPDAPSAAVQPDA
jgi:hypothetical protein